ncbi:hypothetical protein [Aureibacillus halotolerans]|uniref:Uncharacterized protein n=1 Tax=Aureibacillus halotolerans TaxID=1508390 RepID=A0A4R6U2P2_9BACI|nr:hypothetical protein [Aureibacillus halotolerans]TDQ37384.1 hypothetical protein EV213_11318 [Aureibacillus halotolerans]
MTKIKSCFIITPIGNAGSPTRRSADGVIKSVLKPELKKLGYEVSVSHEMTDSGSITRQILDKIISSDMVIANLTELNPNVMYELAVRHGARKPVVQVAVEGTKLPFDIIDERTLFFVNDMQGVTELKDKIGEVIESAENEENPDNPIFRTLGEKMYRDKLLESDSEKFDNSKKLDDIELMLKKLVSKSITSNNNIISKSDFSSIWLTCKNNDTNKILDILGKHGFFTGAGSRRANVDGDKETIGIDGLKDHEIMEIELILKNFDVLIEIKSN